MRSQVKPQLVVVSVWSCHNLSVLLFAKTIGVAMYRAAVTVQCSGVLVAPMALLLSACAQLPVSVEAEPPVSPASLPLATELQASPGYPVQIYAFEAGLSDPGGSISTAAAEWPLAPAPQAPLAETPAVAAASAAQWPVTPTQPREPVFVPALLPKDVVLEAVACEVQPAPSIYYFQQAVPTPVGPAAGAAPLLLPVPQAVQPQSPILPTATPRVPVPVGASATTVGRIPPAAAASFTIGPGDTVQIDVLGRPELSVRGSVSDDGQVTSALIGAVAIGGLTPAQAAARIAESYRAGQYLVAPQVTVTIVDYQSQLLTVLGEVGRPGRFPIRTRLSVLDALAVSGGITEQGASMAYLLRPEDSLVTRYEIDLDALIQTGAGQQYFELLAGDILVVPKAEVFYIYGEVRSPNAYKIKPGITVIQALSLAGGLTDKGTDRRIDIRRRDSSGTLRTLPVSLNELLLADDVIYIRERLF